MKSLFSLVYGGFMLFCAYFCLWAISDFFLTGTALSVLFLPFALRLGVNLHTKPHFWGVSYGVEIGVLYLLSTLDTTPNALFLWLLSAISFPITWLARSYYIGNEMRKLSVQAITSLLISLCNALIGIAFDEPFFFTFLVSLAGKDRKSVV